MSNALVKDGKPWNSPLIGNGGAIKTVNVINPMPKTVKEMVNNYLQDVDITRIRSYANRDTEVKAIKKIIKARGGIDGRIARLPRGAIVKGDPNKTVWVYDGDHTRHIMLAMNPAAKTMPMHVIEVDSLEEVNKLFINNNKTGKTKITTEQEFVNLFHCRDAEVVQNVNFAKKVGLHVYCSHEEDGRVGELTGPEVKVNTLRKLSSACKTTHVSAKEAVSLVTETAAFDRKHAVPLHLTLALTMLNECYPSLVGKQRNKFRAWFKGLTNNLQLNDVVKLAQSRCGQAATGSQDTYYVALGLLKLLRQQKIEGLKTLRLSTLEKRFSKINN
tara:strand:- start:84 stop:1073 length:990 start_codon:yes stop_codon:yes gene_type:complete